MENKSLVLIQLKPFCPRTLPTHQTRKARRVSHTKSCKKDEKKMCKENLELKEQPKARQAQAKSTIAKSTLKKGSLKLTQT